MSKFQIGDFAKSVGAAVSKLDTSEQLQYLDIDLLDANEANFYELSNLQPLADSIAMDGLQQPLVVTPEENGRYKVLSGHRRRAAIRLLLEESEDPLPKLRSVPCLVRRYKSQHLAELQLILANSTARELTSADKMRQAERIEMLLYQLKEEGYQFPGRMRDQVAAACNVSAPKLARLKVIREHLIPEYMVAFEANRLPEQTAYALARMQDDFQARLYRVLKGDAPNGRRAEELLQLQQEGCAWEPILTCLNGKPCQRGDAFLRHDAECLTYELCKGETCCLQCPKATTQYGACERMCGKAKNLRKDGRDEAKERAAEEDRKRQQRFQAEIRASAARLLRAALAAGLKEQDTLQIKDYRPSVSVKELRSYVSGDFLGRYFYGNDLGRFDHPVELAKKLCCSTDYLLGMSEELTPTPQTAPESKTEPDKQYKVDASDLEIVESHTIRTAVSGWKDAVAPPEEGQRAIVQQEDEDYELAIFKGGQWLELDTEDFANPIAVKDVVRWLPWLTPGEVCEDVPSPQWLAAPPRRSRTVFGTFFVDGYAMESKAHYDADLNQYLFPANGTNVDAVCIGWVPLPERRIQLEVEADEADPV